MWIGWGALSANSRNIRMMHIQLFRAVLLAFAGTVSAGIQGACPTVSPQPTGGGLSFSIGGETAAPVEPDAHCARCKTTEHIPNFGYWYKYQFTSQPKTITDGPYTYPNNMACQWTVHSPGTAMRIQFDLLNTEFERDFVKVYRGHPTGSVPSPSNLVQSLSGSVSGASVFIDSETATVVFSSDSNGVATMDGFSARIIGVPSTDPPTLGPTINGYTAAPSPGPSPAPTESPTTITPMPTPSPTPSPTIFSVPAPTVNVPTSTQSPIAYPVPVAGPSGPCSGARELTV